MARPLLKYLRVPLDLPPGPLASTRLDAELIRRVDAPTACADASKLRSKLGWRPKVGFNELVAMMVDRRIEAIRQAIA